MAVYKVRHEETLVGYFDVEANSVNEAIAKFQRKCKDEGVDLTHMEVISESDSACNTGEHINQYRLSKCQSPTSLAKALLAYVNQFGCDYGSFATVITHDHKTLQQSVMRLFIATIREMANVTPDARNEQTVELAKKIIEIADGYSLPLI